MCIDFEPDKPTVFSGINGEGKSSILDCLVILLSWVTNRLQNPRSNGLLIKEKDITNGQSETSNQITITLDAQQTIQRNYLRKI